MKLVHVSHKIGHPPFLLSTEISHRSIIRILPFQVSGAKARKLHRRVSRTVVGKPGRKYVVSFRDSIFITSNPLSVW